MRDGTGAMMYSCRNPAGDWWSSEGLRSNSNGSLVTKVTSLNGCHALPLAVANVVEGNWKEIIYVEYSLKELI